MDEWVSQVQSYYNARKDEWANCLQSLPASQPNATPSEPTLPWPGTYSLNFGQGATCGSIPIQVLPLTASGTADALTLVIGAAGGTVTTTGTMSPTYAFSTNGTPGSDRISTARILGQFDTDGQGIVIRNGSLELTFPVYNSGSSGAPTTGTCSLTFTGVKTGN